MKKQKTIELKEIVGTFCDHYYNNELSSCAFRLCNTLGRTRKLDITRGKKEIWAAAIVYVIARVNFLFDKENENFITTDTICDFFGTKKTTTGNKATSIEKTFNIGIGDEQYCTTEIQESFSFVELPSGFIVPSKIADTIGKDIVRGIANDEESQEIEEFMLNIKKQEQDQQARKERLAEIKSKKAEEKKRPVNKKQLKLW